MNHLDSWQKGRLAIGHMCERRLAEAPSLPSSALSHLPYPWASFASHLCSPALRSLTSAPRPLLPNLLSLPSALPALRSPALRSPAPAPVPCAPRVEGPTAP